MTTTTRAQWKTTWLQLVDEIAANWAIEVGSPFPVLSFNFAAPATRAGGEPCVLKVCLPDHEFDAEISALTVYDGRGAVRLFEVDRKRRAMLLERAVPGVSIASLPDEESTKIAAEAMKRLWRPVHADLPFQSLAVWSKAFPRYRVRFGASVPLDVDLFEHGEHLFAELLAGQGELVVLHGDLRHYNLLSSEAGRWIAIDPKGVIGERAYEPANWLRNPIGVDHWPDLAQVLSRRIDQFSDLLEIERARIRDWGVAQTVLSACWCLEDDDPHWKTMVSIAEVLRKIPV